VFIGALLDPKMPRFTLVQRDCNAAEHCDCNIHPSIPDTRRPWMTVPRPRINKRVTALRCLPGCSVPPAARHHHDRLLTVEFDIDELLELVELAVTWGELDYSGTGVVPPDQWLDFAACHEWRDPDRAARIFSVAADIALRPGGRQAAYPLLGEVATAS
jgi:hypothetical protein